MRVSCRCCEELVGVSTEVELGEIITLIYLHTDQVLSIDFRISLTYVIKKNLSISIARELQAVKNGKI